METKVIRPLMAEIDITDEDRNHMIEIFDRIMAIHEKIEDKKIAKRILTRTHMVSIVPVIWKSIEDGLSDEQMAEWFMTFYAGKKSATISPIYNSYVRGSKKSDVRHRLDELDKHYTEYFSNAQAEKAS